MTDPSPARDACVAPALLALALALGCSSNVQDLGRNGGQPIPDEPTSYPDQGLGADWAMPSSPMARDLACPLTRPIEGDDCPDRNPAPCTYYGAPEHRPDHSASADPERTTTVCMCMSSRRWQCVQGITVRTLLTPLRDGDACVDPLVVHRRCGRHECFGTVTCRCVGGVARCTP